jgi:hypothetical protein
MINGMAKRKAQQTDSTYFLKLVLYMILGSQWLFITGTSDGSQWQIPVPVGLLIGLVFTSHEHFQLDRKIEYAILLMATLVGFWANVGIFITIS